MSTVASATSLQSGWKWISFDLRMKLGRRPPQLLNRCNLQLRGKGTLSGRSRLYPKWHTLVDTSRLLAPGLNPSCNATRALLSVGFLHAFVPLLTLPSSFSLFFASFFFFIYITGQQVAVVRCEQINISGNFYRNKCTFNLQRVVRLASRPACSSSLARRCA